MSGTREMTREEMIAARSIHRSTPQPITKQCPSCGTAVNPMTDECRGCSD